MILAVMNANFAIAYRSLKKSELQRGWSPECFQASIGNCKNCVHNCKDHSLLDKWRIDWWRNFMVTRSLVLILSLRPKAISNSPNKGKIDKNDHLWTHIELYSDNMLELYWVLPQSTPQLCLKVLHARRVSPKSRVCMFIFHALCLSSKLDAV